MEGRGLSSRLTQDVARNGRLGNLATPLSVQKLQTALHAKAKENPGFRFYALYDKLYRADVLQYAYALARTNRGAPGVDGVRFEDIEAYGLERWLGELAQELRKETYEPEAIRRVYIPKPNGKLRPLGIATIRDRVTMTAAVLVLGAIFGAPGGAIRVPGWAQCIGRGAAGAQPAEYGAHAHRGRGPIRVLRDDPAQ